MFIKKTLSIVFLGLFLVFGFAGAGTCGITAKILSNGNDVTSLTIKLGDTVEFEHGGSNCCGFMCLSSFDWEYEVQLPGSSTWEVIENGTYLPSLADTDFRFLQLGTYKVRLSIDCSGVSTDTVDVVVECDSAGSCNNYPIVLVHGFIGWGREEFNFQEFCGPEDDCTLHYWGGSDSGDLEKEMNNRGFTVFTASVGPVSSVWDRACELYAQLMGTDVFYGEAHSAIHDNIYVTSNGTHLTSITTDAACDADPDCIGKYTHARHGNDRKNDVAHAANGLLVNSEGKTIDPIIDLTNSTVSPIHLVGHSMGGQTIRVLAELLAEGSPNCSGDPGDKSCESDSELDTEQNLLFKGGNSGIIRSITTISTPNNGTNLTFIVNDLLDSLGSFAIDIFDNLLSTNISGGLEDVYDFDADHWMGPNPSEYANGIRDVDAMIKKNCGEDSDELCGANECTAAKPTIWDFSMWDLSPCGAEEINNYADAESDIYYFSISTEQAFRCSIDDQWYSEDAIRSALPLYWFPDSPTNNWGANFFSLLAFAPDNMGFDEYTLDEGLGTDDASDNRGANNTTPIGGSWKEQDGIVNTISMPKPSCDSFTTNQNGEAGKWLSLDILHEDHFDITGGMLGFIGEENLTQDDGTGDNGSSVSFMDYYDDLFTRLWKLPAF